MNKMYVPNYLDKNYSDVIEKKVGDYINTYLNVQADKWDDLEIYYIGKENNTLLKGFYIIESYKSTIQLPTK